MKAFFRILLVFSLVWVISRTAIYLLPGDPAEFLVHESLVQTTPDALRSKMDLNQSGFKRIFSFPGGTSLIKKESSPTLVKTALLKSLLLAFLSLWFSALFTGTALYVSFIYPKHEKWITHVTAIFASIPLFVAGPLLILLFCVQLKWLSPVQSPLLPAFTLALHLSSFWYRTLKQRLDTYLNQSAVIGARARGISEDIIFFKYLFAPILGSFLAYFGTQIGVLLNGSLLVEIIFQWNGLGSLLAESVLSRDYPVIVLCLLTVTLITLCSQQAGYWLQSFWEPTLQ